MRATVRRFPRRSRLLVGCVLVALLAVFDAPAAAAPRMSSAAASELTFTAIDVGEPLGCGQTRDVPTVARPGPAGAAAADTAAGGIICWNDGGAWDYTGEVESFSVGWYSVCAITPASDLVCRGNLESVVPADPGEFQSVSVGVDHLCAIRTNGALACWGNSTWLGTPVAEAGPFSSVTAAWTSTCAVLVSGGVRCWPEGVGGLALADIAGQFSELAAGRSHTCGLLVDGTLQCWGDDSHGQVGQTPSGAGYVALAATENGTCALRESGRVTCWGSIPGAPPPSDDMVGIGAGPTAVCGVTTAHWFSCWGAGQAIPAAPGGPASTEVSGRAQDPFSGSSLFTGNPRPTYSVVSGTLPPGLAVHPEAVISGRPTRLGVYAFRLSATNLFGTATTEVRMTVTCGPNLDVNADGLADLAVGTPGKDVAGAKDAGTVTVFLGGSVAGASYGELGGVELTQEQIGQTSSAGDRFGAALAMGDVSGDGCPDLVVGAPGEAQGSGQVTALLASASGVGAGQRLVLRQGGGAAGTAEAGDQFGAVLSLRAGVLWVGSPGEDTGTAKDAGVVTKVVANPLRASGSVQYRQGAGGVPGTSESGDRFGAALFGGYFVGAPGEDVGRVKDAGAVTVGLRRTLTQNTTNVPGVAEAGDAFGSAFARASLGCSSENTGTWRTVSTITLIGVPGEDVDGRADAGAVTMLGGPTAELTQGTPKVDGTVDTGDRFGSALAFGRGFVVSSPGEDIDGVDSAGAITKLGIALDCGVEGDGPFRIRFTGGTGMSPGAAGIPGEPQARAGFGTALAGGHPYGAAVALVVGAPGATVSAQAAGAVWVEVEYAPWQVLSQATDGVSGEAQAGDLLGGGLAS